MSELTDESVTAPEARECIPGQAARTREDIAIQVVTRLESGWQWWNEKKLGHKLVALAALTVCGDAFRDPEPGERPESLWRPGEAEIVAGLSLPELLLAASEIQDSRADFYRERAAAPHNARWRLGLERRALGHEAECVRLMRSAMRASVRSVTAWRTAAVRRSPGARRRRRSPIARRAAARAPGDSGEGGEPGHDDVARAAVSRWRRR